MVLGGGGHIELQNASLNEYYARFISNGGVNFTSIILRNLKSPPMV